MQQTILVTGATAGFGKAIAHKFAANGWKLIVIGRRKERLEELCAELKQKYKAETLALCYDIRDKAAGFSAIETLPDAWKKIDVLVNNAGLAAGRDHFEDASLDDWEAMIDTNLKGLLYTSKAVIPLMIAGNTGHIINIGSIAGKEVYEKGNVYCATKHAVDAISKGMRIDLLEHGIKVTAIHPGAAETEFSLVRFKGDQAMADAVYKGYEPLRGEDIADIVFYTTSLPPHVCINDLVVTPTAQANSVHTFKK
ncbi:SDR family NAD(P)-dependent oxidoreductase [Parasegetibacter sp. NRK P23]|uniref:SDR family NAD(P)-dependent oxidoreductase n=1 Tax=Parasegetibacter sp. NRK P23 TaxID=2942999 RepID=UPI0020439AFA|nr:SDR family NAD(P)-dependent oxidoreductase [Parasegetibacter sp. NRK P23]MCM5527159.1 SDR family NAD(P)-dependent oxidoreductase [Parasegetibacter sp. NRK P23]